MSGLFGLFERRASIESPTRPLTDASLLEFLGGDGPTDSGVEVTETKAMRMSAVYRAVSLIAGLGGALPLHTYVAGTKNRAESALLAQPHPDMSSLEFWRLSYVHRALWGNFYARKVPRGRTGQLDRLEPLHPSNVTVRAVPVTVNNRSGKAFDVADGAGGLETLTPAQVFHIPGLGYDGLAGVSPIRHAAQGIGLALAAESYGARLFGSGNLLSGILETEQRLEQSQAEALQRRWREKLAGLGKSHEVAVLDSGAKFHSMTMPNDDAQLLESRHFQISDIARYFGVPAFLLGETEKSTSWGTGLEQQAQGFVTFDLHPMWLAPTEQRVTKELLAPSGQYAKYALEGLLRGDSTARAQFYTAMRNVGAYSANDILDLEDRPPVEGGDSRLQPLNMAPLGSEDNTEGAGDAPQPAQQ